MALSRQIPADDLLIFLSSATKDFADTGNDVTAYWFEQLRDHIASLKPEQKLVYSPKTLGL